MMSALSRATPDPLIHVILALFEPDPGQLRAQLASLAAQERVDMHLHGVIADLSCAGLVRRLAGELGLKIALHLPQRRLDAPRAFEFGLTEALRGADAHALFALCDQDDIWDRDKLSRTIAALRARGGAHLAHSDARLIDEGGAPLAPSLFALERRERQSDLRRLLVRNSVTGMTVVMTRDLVAQALPFPAQGGQFFYHDLWLALVAAAKGPLAYLGAPTVSYRQHGGNAVGAVVSRQAPWPLSRAWLRRNFAAYALACYLAKCLMLRVEESEMVQPGRFDRARLARLRPYLRHYGTGAAFWRDALGALARGRASQAGQNVNFALVKFGRLLWAGQRALRLDFSRRLIEFDEIGYRMAPGLSPQQGARRSAAAPAAGVSPSAKPWQSYIDMRRVMSWKMRVDPGRAPSCLILLPTLNPTEIFAGVATALDLGLGLAARGHRVRFVATDLPILSPHASRSFLAKRLGAAAGEGRDGLLSRVELVCGVTADHLEIAPEEDLIATAWWTAHVAAQMLRTPGVKTRDFHYLIQDFEPNFYAWGPEFAGAMDSYDLPCRPIFNTTLLRDHVLGLGFEFGGQAPLVFRPSIDIDRYARLSRVPGRRKRRIALYGRPEVARNMFPVGIEALADFVRAKGLSRADTEIVSVGMSHDPVLLPGDLEIKSLGKLPYEEYPYFLTTVDLGLSLMYSPHPSHVPLEMAAAGVRVVTNHFGPKDLSELSPLIQSASPSATALSQALCAAWDQLAQAPRHRERQVALDRLGQDLPEIADALAAQIAARRPARRVA